MNYQKFSRRSLAIGREERSTLNPKRPASKISSCCWKTVQKLSFAPSLMLWHDITRSSTLFCLSSNDVIKYQHKPWCTNKTEGQRQWCGEKTCSGICKSTKELQFPALPLSGGEDFQIDFGRDSSDPADYWDGKLSSVTCRAAHNQFQWSHLYPASCCEKWNWGEAPLQFWPSRKIRRFGGGGEIKGWAWTTFLLLFLAKNKTFVMVSVNAIKAIILW